MEIFFGVLVLVGLALIFWPYGPKKSVMLYRSSHEIIVECDIKHVLTEQNARILFAIPNDYDYVKTMRYDTRGISVLHFERDVT